MDRNSTNYVLVFVTSMTVAVAFLLAGLLKLTEATAKENEAIFNKRAILSAVNEHLGMGEGVYAKDLEDAQVLEVFDSRVTSTTIMANTVETVDDVVADGLDLAKEKKKDLADRRLPFFKYDYEGKSFYIMAVRGKGLWDDIWGYIALEADINTIAGASFDHKGETPGLGAEIKDNPVFADNFIGTKIFKNGEFVSVKVRKGGARDKVYEVDGISGATVTADGVDDMLRNELALYLPYLETLQSTSMLNQ